MKIALRGSNREALFWLLLSLVSFVLLYFQVKRQWPRVGFEGSMVYGNLCFFGGSLAGATGIKLLRGERISPKTWRRIAIGWALIVVFFLLPLLFSR